MELEKLVSRNFKPRDDLMETAEKLIHEEIKALPANGKVKAVITDQGNSFNISMVASTDNRIFSSESSHAKAQMRGAPRLWQLDSLRLVLKDLVRQIKKHLNLD